MMNCANMMGGAAGASMMGGMAIEWIVLIALELLGLAALIKFLRTPRRP